MLGYNDETVREDRDNYIVWPGGEATNSRSNFGCPYDFGSIMQPQGSSDSFMPIDPLFRASMGQRIELSFCDVYRANMAYDCCDTLCTGPKPACVNGGYQNPNSCTRCICPPGFGGNLCETYAPRTGSSFTCGGIVTLSPCSKTSITSPNYPDPYPDAEGSCSWHVKAVSF